MPVNHTTIRNDSLFCLHCGESHKMTYPIEIPKLTNKINLFNALHKDCKKNWVEPQCDMSQSKAERIKWWLDNGEKGASSKAMLYACYGIGEKRNCHPVDPSDFHRCHKLIKVLPEIKESFYRVKDISAPWSNLVDNWDRLTELLEEQLQGKKDNGMYDFMSELINNKNR